MVFFLGSLAGASLSCHAVILGLVTQRLFAMLSAHSVTQNSLVLEREYRQIVTITSVVNRILEVTIITSKTPQQS